jgi:hypothetical protein
VLNLPHASTSLPETRNNRKKKKKKKHDKPEWKEPPAKRAETALSVVLPDELGVLMVEMQDRIR